MDEQTVDNIDKPFLP